MNRAHPLYLVVYDISCDRERGRTAAVLEGYGVRVQESVFEVRLSPAMKHGLQTALLGLQLETGWVSFYRVDERSRRWQAGIALPNPLAEDRHAWIL